MSQDYRRWNAGRMVGPRTGFRQSELLHLIELLLGAGMERDLALLTTGVDTMLRASDLLQLRVEDVQTRSDVIRQTLLWRQQKTQANVTPVLTPVAQKALAVWIRGSRKKPGDYLFTRHHRPHGPPISASTYRRAVKSWAGLIGLDPTDYSSHSIRRTKPIFMYRAGCPIADISKLLGHKSTDVTLHYLGITTEHLQAQALKYDIFVDQGKSP